MSKPKINNLPDFHLVCFSGGKDSTAMLLKMVENKMPIDMVLFLDTGFEFPSMYEHIEKVEKEIGLKITKLGPAQDFEYLLTEHEHIKRSRSKNPEDRQLLHGYGWPSMPVRWCTHELKDVPREKFLKELREKYNLVEYIGIAADETKRLERPRHKKGNKHYPLIEWNMTEADCLAYCKERGFDWDGLYDHFHRVSCWMCPLKSLDELRKLYEYYPELWKKLEEMDNKARNTYLRNWAVWQLAYRFEFEKRWSLGGGALTIESIL